jgi:carboxylesterase type B
MSVQHLLLSCLLAVPALAAPQLLDSLLGTAPQITLDYGTFKGTKAFRGVDSYLGIPFAKAGRFENPTVLSVADKLSGVQDATKYGKSCPQQQLIASPIGAENAQIGSILSTVEQLAFLPVANQGEDCLSVNVQVPAGLNSTAGLPVIFWIHGGGWELGSSGALGSETTVAQGVLYQGAHLVQQSMKIGRPIVFVSANHRLNAFGALASQEITDAGVSNLHLKDQ